MLRLMTLLVAVVTLCPPASGEDFGYFPAMRVHEDAYLRPTFRLTLESLLDTKTPAQLVRRSLGEVPKFAAAPVVDNPKNPFSEEAAVDAIAETAPVDGEATPSSDPFDDDRANDSDPFGSSDPFSASDDGDPFASPVESAPASEDADPFADGGEDPFGDF